MTKQLSIRFGDESKKIHLRSQLSLIRVQINIMIKKRSFSGIAWEFSSKKEGMEGLEENLERAIISQYDAHQESDDPAWWLRAISIKN